MVQKFRNKIVVIEAIQFTEDNLDAVIEFCGKKIKSHPMTGVVIETPEGNLLANIGDWIIKGVNGEFYPCKPDIFEKTYESADKPEGNLPIILYDQSIIPTGMNPDDFIKEINSGKPVGILSKGRHIKDLFTIINR